MDFYDATSAKQYSRNKTRIIKEINDIEETIAQAVDEGQFECDVYDTFMTDARDVAEPIREAKAHCIMELSKIIIHNDELIDEIYCNSANYSEEPDSMTGGNADVEYEEDAPAVDGGDADNTDGVLRKNYFRVGEDLVVRGRNDIKPLEFKVKEINENGDIIDVDIISRGEFTDEIFEEGELEYKDMTSWLDINSDFGLISDIKITRDNEILVKDLTGIEEAPVSWFQIGDIFNLNSIPSDSFGIVPDAYIKNQNEIYIKTENGWKLSNKIYDYASFKMPFNFGLEGTVCYNVFGKTWIKTHCGWYVSNNTHELGERVSRPDVFAYNYYDIVLYTELVKDKEGNVVKKIPHKMYKCCHNAWKDVMFEYDWSECPSYNFGNDLDMFIYPEGNYRVKVDGIWSECPTEFRFDQMYLEEDFGEIHDVITYSGEFEPYTTYVKMGATIDKPNGYWKQVEKVWDLNSYLLGRLPVNAEFLWTVKDVVLTEKGDGYMYDTSVIFSEGNASALVKTINEKITGIKLIYGGDDYITIPEVNFVMSAPTMAKKYYQVWKQLAENQKLQDEMKQVIEYFENTKIYTISRVTNAETGNSFYWHVSWY